jgi:hypothetical protein
MFRPELRSDYSWDARAYNARKSRNHLSFGMDVIYKQLPARFSFQTAPPTVGVQVALDEVEGPHLRLEADFVRRTSQREPFLANGLPGASIQKS